MSGHLSGQRKRKAETELRQILFTLLCVKLFVPTSSHVWSLVHFCPPQNGICRVFCVRETLIACEEKRGGVGTNVRDLRQLSNIFISRDTASQTCLRIFQRHVVFYAATIYGRKFSWGHKVHWAHIVRILLMVRILYATTKDKSPGEINGIVHFFPAYARWSKNAREDLARD